MAKPSEGRSIELLSSTTEQRKAIARVISAIRATTHMGFEDIYIAAQGSLIGRAEEDERNLPKGKLAHRKMAHFYRWIVENYLPLGCEIAPEVFDPSLLTRWRDFIRAHGIYDRLTYRFAGNLGLTQRSSVAPIADQPIPMGKPYLFELDCGISGQLLALEVAKGKTYPVALHPEVVSNIFRTFDFRRRLRGFGSAPRRAVSCSCIFVSTILSRRYGVVARQPG